jgi:hypothetical protein
LIKVIAAIAGFALIFARQKLQTGSSGIKQLTGRSSLTPLNAAISVLNLDAKDLVWTPVFVEYASQPAPLVKTEPEYKLSHKSSVPCLKRVGLTLILF